jgi:hypothetical protein
MSRCGGHGEATQVQPPSGPCSNPRSPLGRGSYRRLEELIKRAEELERKCGGGNKDGRKAADEDLTDFQRMKKKIAKDVQEVRQVLCFLPSFVPICTCAAAPQSV